MYFKKRILKLCGLLFQHRSAFKSAMVASCFVGQEMLMYWTLGEYDQVCIFEAPDDETAASVLLAADMLGKHTQPDDARFHGCRDG